MRNNGNVLRWSLKSVLMSPFSLLTCHPHHTMNILKNIYQRLQWSSFHKTNHYGKFTLLNIQQAMQLVLSYFRKHGRGWEGASPESDAAQHEMQRPMWLPTRWCRIWVFFFFSRIHADSARFAPNRADSAKIGSYQLATETSQNQPWIWSK